MPTLREIFTLQAGELISAWAFFSGTKINGAVFLYLPALLCEGYWNFHHRVRLMSQSYLKRIYASISVTPDAGRPTVSAPRLGSRRHNSTIHQAEPPARRPAWLKIELFRALSISPSLSALRLRLIIQTDGEAVGGGGGGKGGAGNRRSNREDQRGQRSSSQISTAEILNRSGCDVASSRKGKRGAGG